MNEDPISNPSPRIALTPNPSPIAMGEGSMMRHMLPPRNAIPLRRQASPPQAPLPSQWERGWGEGSRWEKGISGANL